MKLQNMVILVIAGMIFCTGYVSAKGFIRPPYFDKPADIVYVGTGKNLPVLIFMPATDITAQKYFAHVKDAQMYQNYIAVLPQGKPKRSEYSTDFGSYIKGFEKNLLTDLAHMRIQGVPMDVSNIYMQGASLGGDLSWALLVRNKRLFAGASIIASRMSYPLGKQDIAEFLEYKNRIALTMGSKDSKDRQIGMQLVYDRLRSSDISVAFFPFPAGHQLPSLDIYKKGVDYITQ